MGTTWPIELRQYSILRLVICSPRVPGALSNRRQFLRDVVPFLETGIEEIVLLTSRPDAPAKAGTILVVVVSLPAIKTFLCLLLLLEGC